jgi:small subunit ribosomal protein S17e
VDFLGRIKTRLLKAATKSMLDSHAERFDTTFEKNKVAVLESADVSSKKMRNIIAGYATRLKKTGKY